MALLASLPRQPEAQAQPLPVGDIVFIFDESGTMSSDILEFQANINTIASELSGSVDFQLGLVGFGAKDAPNHSLDFHGQAHIHSALTSDVGVFANALDQLTAEGSTEPGFSATVLAMSDEMGFRPGAGVCGILISDADADVIDSAPETRADALAALNGRNAALIAIVRTAHGSTTDDYGPNPGSLSEATGGQTFETSDFRTDQQPVLSLILDSCVEVIEERAGTIVAPTPGSDTGGAGTNGTTGEGGAGTDGTVTDSEGAAPDSDITSEVSEGPDSEDTGQETTGEETTDANGQTTSAGAGGQPSDGGTSGLLWLGVAIAGALAVAVVGGGGFWLARHRGII